MTGRLPGHPGSSLANILWSMETKHNASQAKRTSVPLWLCSEWIVFMLPDFFLLSGRKKKKKKKSCFLKTLFQKYLSSWLLPQKWRNDRCTSEGKTNFMRSWISHNKWEWHRLLTHHVWSRCSVPLPPRCCSGFSGGSSWSSRPFCWPFSLREGNDINAGMDITLEKLMNERKVFLACHKLNICSGTSENCLKQDLFMGSFTGRNHLQNCWFTVVYIWEGKWKIDDTGKKKKNAWIGFSPTHMDRFKIGDWTKRQSLGTEFENV